MVTVSCPLCGYPKDEDHLEQIAMSPERKLAWGYCMLPEHADWPAHRPRQCMEKAMFEDRVLAIYEEMLRVFKEQPPSEEKP
jgi:hypothetical protein